jgi:caffeoyl-CoA O-methyltransferase
MERLLPTRDPVLQRLEREAAVEGIPAIGPHEGMLLGLLSRLVRPRRIVELGTAIGYSAIWLARGSPEAELVTFEADSGRAERARQNLAEAGLADRAEVREGDALDGLRGIAGGVDIVFNDLLNSLSDEAAVELSFRLSVDRLRPAGLLLADNALRQGEVVEPATRQARNVSRYNDLAASEPGFESVIVPLRDGLSISWRA